MDFAPNYVEGEEPNIAAEIEWTIKELTGVEGTVEILHKELALNDAYKTELVSYLSGMQMAKRFIEGGNLHDADFWSWVDDDEDIQLEINFTPDFELDTDE
jgi:hypothetical protein